MTLKYSSGVVAAMLLLSGCGARRYTWVYDRKDLQQSPKTQQKYSIQSFVVTPFAGQKNDATAQTVKLDRLHKTIVSREWVDFIYEPYPDVFDPSGIPLSLTAEETYSTEPLTGFERSAARKFIGSIGFITLLPLLPAEVVTTCKWRMTVGLVGQETAEVELGQVDENTFSMTPLGLLCSYSNNSEGDYQVAVGQQDEKGEVLRAQMEALGAGIAAELIAMEKDGRIKVGGKGASAADESQLAVEPQLTEKQDERSRILAEERRKNLDSLLKSGVITEEEYKKELGKAAK